MVLVGTMGEADRTSLSRRTARPCAAVVAALRGVITEMYGEYPLM